MFLFLRYRFIGGPSSFTPRFTVLKEKETEKSEMDEGKKRLVTVASRMNFFLGSSKRKKQEGDMNPTKAYPCCRTYFIRVKL